MCDYAMLAAMAATAAAPAGTITSLSIASAHVQSVVLPHATARFALAPRSAEWHLVLVLAAATDHKFVAIGACVPVALRVALGRSGSSRELHDDHIPDYATPTRMDA
eukprot:CAMPEP_0115831014 /NCGR_PEP_ID=MMETSP0287-20121206/1920_1 /TAXON_ID=412157 /ORGANISM="Chrysochromulina rotalis, Strain UIO044" /LENGTH=106 /DNA_ID=CAMNT_0003284347 /DNA_START=448 /DNA_END=770 /DNA_ORIENTATION=+